MWMRIVDNALQVLVVLAFAPLVSGVLRRLVERLQSKRGPPILQPYYDLWKLFHKDQLFSEQSTWLYRFTPYLALVAPLIVCTLIPVLTRFPLYMAFMADMVGAGFILALGSFFSVCAAIDAANPYGALGASRTRMVGFLVEPIFMMVFFAVAGSANSTIPYVVQQQWVTSGGTFFAPSHLLLLVAFFMIVLAETGRIPVDNPAGHFELAMIDEAKSLEYSGRGAALMHWASACKLLVLLIVLLNVLLGPWGLSASPNPLYVLAAIPLIALKVLAAVIALAVIEVSFAKLRLFRIPDFLGAAFITSVLAMIARIFYL